MGNRLIDSKKLIIDYQLIEKKIRLLFDKLIKAKLYNVPYGNNDNVNFAGVFFNLFHVGKSWFVIK